MPPLSALVRNGRLFARTAWKAFHPAVPPYLIYFVTHRCNARCSFCFNRGNQEKANADDELDAREVYKIAEKFRGVIHVTLTGGEPFLREDLYEPARAFVNAGAESLTIATNGTLTERIVETAGQLLDEFPGLSFDLDLSVDGPAELHDRLRGVPGAHEKVMTSAKKLAPLQEKHPGFRLGASVTVCAFNQDTAEQTVRELAESGLFRRVQVLWVRGRPFDPKATDADFSVYQACRRYLDATRLATGGSKAKEALSRRAREVVSRTVKENRMVLPCRAGTTMATMDPYGNVYPCEMLWQVSPEGDPGHGLHDWVMGSLRDKDFDIKKVLATDKARKVRQWIKDRKCFCSFECAAYNNIVFNPRAWPGVIKSWK
ncbi:MAG: radical SAM protein [bacterium]